MQLWQRKNLNSLSDIAGKTSDLVRVFSAYGVMLTLQFPDLDIAPRATELAATAASVDNEFNGIQADGIADSATVGRAMYQVLASRLSLTKYAELMAWLLANEDVNEPRGIDRLDQY